MTATPAFRRFLVSAAAALVVGCLTWRSLERARREGAAGPTGTVLVLKRPAPAGHVLDANDIDARTLPLAFAEPGAVRDAKEVKGARTRIALVKGEQLTRSKLESDSSRLGLAWTLAPGFTAMSLRLSAESAVGGHALPGDWVEIFSAASRESTATPLIRRARVVAVQDRVWEPGGAPPSPLAANVSNESFLVTLMLTPEQVSRVASAIDRSRLTLALLSALDDEPGGRSEITR